MNEILEIKRRTRPPVPTFQEIIKTNETVKVEFDNDGSEFTANHIKEFAKFENEVIDNSKELVKSIENDEAEIDK